MDFFDWQNFRATPLNRDPYEHVIVNGFVKTEALRKVNLDYPRIEDTGSFPVEGLKFGPGFEQLVQALESDEFRNAFEQKFEVDLSGRPTTITVRGRCSGSDGQIHTDSVGKIITILIYLNPVWDDSGGRLRLLRAKNIEDVAAEVVPSGGNLVAFLRSDHSWHGHLPFTGERRVLQFNWVVNKRNQTIVRLRHRLSASVKHLLRSRHPQQGSVSTSPPDRLLLVRLSSLGDLVHTLPVVPALSAAFPGTPLDWLVDSRWSPLIKLVRGISDVIPLQSSVSGYLRCMRQVRRNRYSRVIDFQGIYRSAFFGWISGAPRRIGRERNSARERGAARFYTDAIVPSGRHVAEMSMSLAVHAGAQPPAGMQFPIEVPADELMRLRKKLSGEDAQSYIVLSPGGGWKSKCWPAERFGALCAQIWQRNKIRSVINLAPGEEQLGKEVVASSFPAQPLVYCPALPELVALSSRALLVVGADTGPLHLAAALGTRVIALFGSTNASRNGPLPHGLVIQNFSGQPPNYQRGDYVRGPSYSPEMLSITVDQVLTAVEQEISRRSVAPLQP